VIADLDDTAVGMARDALGPAPSRPPRRGWARILEGRWGSRDPLDGDDGEEPRAAADVTGGLPGFDAAFREESRHLLIERGRLLLWTALVLYPAFWGLDLLVAREHALGFLGIRAGMVAAYLIALAALATRWAPRLARPVLMICSLGSAAGISVMAAQLGGFDNTYFAGNILVLFAIGVVLPWRPEETLALSAAIILVHLGINFGLYGLSSAGIAPVFFLIGAAIFTHLAALSGERTRRRDLALRLRLESANFELQELDEAKTRFFANVSHELRTPLTLLMGPLDTLLAAGSPETADPAERLVLLESMATNARRLLRQVDALLDGAKLDAGRLRLDPESGHIGRLLAELIAAAEPHAARRGIRLRGEGLETLSESIFDPHKLEIIAANLISNAVKFTPEGGRITVRAVPVVDRIVFEVEDNGPGIPSDQLERIFERFHQVDGSLSREQGGTGLGLALARELARLHNGNVTVRSTLGEGSVFRVDLPLDASAPAERRRRPRRREDQIAQARTDSLAARQYALQSMRDTLLADVELPRLSRERLERPEPPAGAPRILLVEDNADLRLFLENRLSRCYRIETAADGTAGLEAALRTPPDLIVTDVMMAGLDGYELCRRLRADPAFAATPIVLLTARAGPDAVVEGLEVGADDYVVKPFAMRELEARIAAHLRAKETERQLHERESRLAVIGQMTSSVVHDLRNPLTLVKGYTDLAHTLALRGGDAAIARELEHVSRASERLRRMVEEILDFARGGAPTLQLATVSVRGFFAEALMPLITDLEERRIRTHLDLQVDHGLTITLDRDRIQRALENLLSNAREAVQSGGTDGGDQRVFVQVAREGESVTIRVADTGPGIPEEAYGHLFEPFATAGKKQGTGLGLVTVHTVARAHGGAVRAERSAPEGGAAFTLVLPLAPEVGTKSR
jgi:signal transduction histidine kinase